MTNREKKLFKLLKNLYREGHYKGQVMDEPMNFNQCENTLKQILELDLVLEAKTHKEQYDDFRRAVDKIRELKQEITRYKEALVEIINADNKDSESCGICGRLAKQALMKG